MKRFMIFIFFILNILLSQKLPVSWYKSQSSDYLTNGLLRLNSFLQIPNASRDSINISANVLWCREVFDELGFVINYYEVSSTPFLFASKLINNSLPTVLVYLQIDGVPVELSQWNQDSPYIPIVRNRKKEIIDWNDFILDPKIDDKIFARSASDSKGPAVAFITALQVIKEKNIEIPFNVKVIMDFQEEISSPDLPKLVKMESSTLKADYLLIMDGSRFIDNKPTLTFGARGISKIELTIYGPKNPVHSGQYGNFIPNPVFEAARLISSLKDKDGIVSIPGWYGSVNIEEDEFFLMEKNSIDPLEFAHSFGVADYEKVGKTYQESLQYPSLNIRGISAGWIGNNARTIIPDKVEMVFDIRLVPEMDGETAIGMVRDYLRKMKYRIIESEPSDRIRTRYSKLVKFSSSIGYPAFQTPLNSPIGEWLNRAHMNALGNYPISIRRTGGSQPMAPFVKVLGLPAVSVRIPNPDNNIHGPNENIRVGNFLEGIQINLGILTTPINDR